MNKFVLFAIVFFLLFATASRVMAQTASPDTSDQNGPSPVTLTASGSQFAKGAADGQCTVADASCTTSDKKPGICVDNGLGAGVCAAANPTIDPMFDQGCGPNEICHVAPEKVGRKNDVGQSKTKDCGQKDCTGSLWEFIQNWIGEVHPQGIYHYGTQLLTLFGFQIFNSFSKDLAPADLQKITLYDVQPKPYCMTSRLCVYDPVTHELVGNYLTQETWCTNDPPARKELIMGTRLAAAAMTTKYTVGTDLRLPYTAVKKIAALPCGAKLDEGRTMDLQSSDYIKTNYYGDDTITHFAITIQADMVSIVQRFIEKLDKYVDIFQATEHTPAVDVGSAENGLSASVGCISFTCTQADLQPFSYPVTEEGKNDLTHGGGLWDTYRNDAFDVQFKTPTDARYETQDWFYGMAGEGNMQSPTLQSMNARQENAQLFGNCSIIPAGLQNQVFANGECNQSWVAGASTTNPAIASVPPSEPVGSSSWARPPNSTSSNPISPNFTPPSHITAGNATALVPACMLEGVAQIEGAYEGGAPCTPNECGAYGPFQITIGNCKPSCGASSCPNAAQQLGVTKAQLCDFNSAAYQAARLLVGKSKYFGFPLTNADPKTQRQAIIIAGDSYYGTTAAVGRLGGLSYGEWVYAHCDPSYTTHVNHSFPKVGG